MRHCQRHCVCRAERGPKTVTSSTSIAISKLACESAALLTKDFRNSCLQSHTLHPRTLCLSFLCPSPVTKASVRNEPSTILNETLSRSFKTLFSARRQHLGFSFSILPLRCNIKKRKRLQLPPSRNLRIQE